MSKNNLPEKAFLYGGFSSGEATGGTWSKDQLIPTHVEFIRKDIADAEAEQMAKEFAEWWNEDERIIIPQGHGKFLCDESGFLYNVNQLFTEFINSRKAKK